MRPLTTLILLALAAAAVSFIFFFERRQPSTRQVAEQSRYVLQLDPTQITGVEIANAAGKMAFQRQADRSWRLTAPVEDRADAAGLSQILALADGAEVDQRIPGAEAEKKSELRAYGLDKGNPVRVVFRMADGASHSVLVGKSAAYEDSAYLRVEAGEKPDVLVARTKARGLLARAPGEWRDTRVVAPTADELTRLAIRGAAGEIQLEHEAISPEARKRGEQALWSITKPLTERADQEMVSDRLLPGLLQAKIKAFADALPAAAAQPALQITLSGAKLPAAGEVLEIFADDDPSVAWMRSSLRPGVGKISGELLVLRKLKLDDLRSTRLAALDFRRLTTVIVRDAVNGEIPLYAVKGHWHLAHEKLVYEANRDRLQKLVETFNNAEILEWADVPGPPGDYGLEQPFLELVFGSAPHASRTQPTAPTAENSLTLRLGRNAHNRFYAQWAGKPTVYRFDGAILGTVQTEWFKYKSARLLSFPPLALRSLTLGQDPSPPVELTFLANEGGKWTARRAGDDVTEYLDKPRVERLVSRLSELTADDWALDAAAATEALKNPALRVRVTVDQFVDGSVEPTPTTVSLTLAPTSPNQRTALYFGRLNDEPNAFVLRRETFDELAAPVLVNKTAASQ